MTSDDEIKELLSAFKTTMAEVNRLKEENEQLRSEIPNFQSSSHAMRRGSKQNVNSIVKRFEEALLLTKDDRPELLSIKGGIERDREEAIRELGHVVAEVLVYSKKKDIPLRFPDPAWDD